MCGGSDHHGKETHHQPNQERHEDCSCGRLGGLSFILNSLVMLSMVTHVACDKGEVSELLKSNSAFRGAVSLDLSPGGMNFNLLQSLTTERILEEADLYNEMLPMDIRAIDKHLVDRTKLAESDTEQTRPKLDSEDDDQVASLDDNRELLGATTGKASKLLHAGEEEEEGALSMSRVGHVLGASAVMLVVSAFGVSLPYLIRRFSKDASQNRRDNIRSICCGFAAGGFWGLALIHVLVEAVNGCSIIRYGLTFASGAFMNAAFALCALGYLLMMAIQTTASISSRKTALRGSGEDMQFHAAMFDAAVAAIALTFHSFFEGMVVGMRDTHLLIWVATISVIGHKWAAGFALSMRMEVHNTPTFLKWTTLSIFIFASPVGALVGMPLGTMETSGSAVVLNALSAGILIFVASETTTEVFGSGNCGECSTEVLVPNAVMEDRDAECHDPCCVNRNLSQAHQNQQLQRPASFRLFAAQLLAFIAGLGLVFGMMCLHMRNPGHEHAE